MRSSRLRPRSTDLTIPAEAPTMNVHVGRQTSQDNALAVVNLPFLGEDGSRIKLHGIYKKQQTRYDIHRVRYYCQEDGYGKKAANIFSDNVVGLHGITVDFGDETLNELWREWEWDPENPEDDFASIQRLMIFTIVRDGESIFHITGNKDNFYVAPIDVLDLPLSTQITPGPSVYESIGYVQPIYSGINRDDFRRPVSYSFYPEIGQPYVLAAENVIHGFLKEYAGQERGLSWFLGSLDTMSELSAFESDVSQAIKNAASDPGNYSVPKAWLPTILEGEANTESKASVILNRLINRAPDRRGILPDGVAWNPTQVGNVFQGQVTESHRKTSLMRIAACVGISYPMISGDYSAGSFSSMQQGNMDNRALFRKSQGLLLASVKKVAKRWLMFQSLQSGAMESRCRNAKIRFLLPPFEYIDRAKAVQADEKKFNMGATSLSELIRADGQEPQAVFRQQAEDEAMRRKYYEEYDVPYPGDMSSDSSDLTNDNKENNIDDDEGDEASKQQKKEDEEE